MQAILLTSIRAPFAFDSVSIAARSLGLRQRISNRVLRSLYSCTASADYRYLQTKRFSMSQRSNLLWAAIFVCALAFPSGAAAETTQGFAARELALAHDLLSRAAAIVERTPSDRMSAAMMVRGNQGPAGRFYEDEREYQKALTNRAHALAGRSDNLLSTLLQSDAFLYDAVQSAVAGCNRHDAAANLRVARAIIRESDRIAAGHPSSDFSLPEIKENGAVLCR